MSRRRAGFESIARLAELADFTLAFAIRAVAHLGVADHLAEGPRRVGDLAAEIGAHERSLLRTLRALATAGVFAEPEPGLFALTPLSELLRGDHPLSMRWAFRLRPDVDAWAEMEHTLRTGETAFDHVFGTDYWSHLAANPALQAQFRDSQRALTRLELQTLTRLYDWRGLRTVVDLGGNDGTFLCGLLSRYPQMRGTVFDLPGTVAEAAKTAADAGVADRCAAVGGSLFETPLPAGADAYTIKRVLIGLADDEVVTLLRILRGVMRPDSRLLVLEPRDAPDDLSISMDLHMLVLGEGHVRSPERFGELLAEAGMSVAAVVDARLLNLIDARPG
ncbi:methyltransferase [Bailinhaonella thermotolerans]|uniref:Methyltransferase n=1 Tax=Bailinhaonella thermotolerans TaxID=1070861 RepID=A0A3A4AJG7_9ACTN|nr:methyltransferase [Bailinhaonella thermotolerans]RJL27224.1 methyltransferase [Bailinhaonella thermotolerans]